MKFLKFLFLFVSLFVYIKIFSIVYLKYYPHSFIREYFPVIKYLLIVLIFVFSFKYLWQKIKEYYLKFGHVVIFVAGLLFLLAFLIISSVNKFNFNVDTEYYPVGFDQRTYYSWAQDILKNKTFFVEPTIVFSKPMFLYFKALLMIIFGDKTIAMDTFTHWMMLILPILLVFTSLLSLSQVFQKRTKWYQEILAIELILAIGAYWYFVTNGWFVRFIAGISEMPSWWFMGIATIIIPLMVFKNKKTVKLIGIFAGLSLLMRTTMIIYLPILFVSVFILLDDDFKFKNFKKLLPIVIAVILAFCLVLIHSKLGTLGLSSVNQYFSDNTTIDTINLGTSLFSRWPKLLPSGYEILVWLFLAFGLLFNFVSKRKWWKIILVFLVVLLTLLVQLPLLSDIYGNRSIFWLYWMLSSLVIILTIDGLNLTNFRRRHRQNRRRLHH